MSWQSARVRASTRAIAPRAMTTASLFTVAPRSRSSTSGPRQRRAALAQLLLHFGGGVAGHRRDARPRADASDGIEQAPPLLFGAKTQVGKNDRKVLRRHCLLGTLAVEHSLGLEGLVAQQGYESFDDHRVIIHNQDL